MDLRDATLMMLEESAGQPVVASLAKVVYDRLVNEEPVDYRLLDELIGEASGKGVLRARPPGHHGSSRRSLRSTKPGARRTRRFEGPAPKTGAGPSRF